MIIDVVENAEKYHPLSPRFADAFRYLRTPASRTLTSARFEIGGGKIFVTASHQQGKKKSEAKLEVHRKYIDIHYILEGVDSMGWKPARECSKVLSPYDEEKDVAFFHDEPLLWCTVPAGSFAIFFPDDAHAPMVSGGEVRKVIVKVAV
jgi:YhcH/YjgK/YiaL family protein